MVLKRKYFSSTASCHEKAYQPLDVRIEYAEDLDWYLEDMPSPRGDLLIPKKDVPRKVTIYRIAWQQVSQDITTGLQRESGLHYVPERQTIWVSDRFGLPIHSPFIIPIDLDKNAFVFTVAHELAHVLLHDNAEEVDGWNLCEQFANDRGIAEHVVIFAILDDIFRNQIHQPKAAEEERMNDLKLAVNNRYRQAWEILDRLSTDEVLQRFRHNVLQNNPRDP